MADDWDDLLVRLDAVAPRVTEEKDRNQITYHRRAIDTKDPRPGKLHFHTAFVEMLERNYPPEE